MVRTGASKDGLWTGLSGRDAATRHVQRFWRPEYEGASDDETGGLQAVRITVRYSAGYQYAQKASFSPHRVRLFPRHDLFVHIERISFSTDASARVQYRHDLFDNAMAICLYPASLDRLDFELEFD